MLMARRTQASSQRKNWECMRTRRLVEQTCPAQTRHGRAYERDKKGASARDQRPKAEGAQQRSKGARRNVNKTPRGLQCHARPERSPSAINAGLFVMAKTSAHRNDAAEAMHLVIASHAKQCF